LYLRSGSTLNGRYAGGDTRQVRMLVGDHVETYQLEDVLRIEFTDHADRSPGLREGRNPDETAPPPPPPAENEIPVNTNLIIRMIDPVNSERDNVGQTYRASIDEAVVVNGQVVLPKGAPVTAKLVNQTESGRFTGRASLTVDLTQIQVNGRMVDIATSEVTQASGARGSKTAKTVGGGAALGAIIGGVIGGGKGAGVGALSGGALGAGYEVVTKGEKVKIPAETRLSFLLQQPVRY
ncbi:MAG: hypothetical protein JO022_04625, partial [Acidobacteriaceae bacterium]|nr:hypothetical protein [Acidobacteriaceae bacterium]